MELLLVTETYFKIRYDCGHINWIRIDLDPAVIPCRVCEYAAEHRKS